MRKPSAIPELLELEHLLPVLFLVLTLFPKRVPPRNELVHDEACCPDVDWLPVALSSGHLLRCLIDERSATLLHALPCLILDSQPKVDELDAVILALLADHDVAGLQISMHIVVPMDVLEAQENAPHNGGALLVLEVPVAVALHQRAQGAAASELHFHHGVVVV